MRDPCKDTKDFPMHVHECMVHFFFPREHRKKSIFFKEIIMHDFGLAAFSRKQQCDGFSTETVWIVECSLWMSDVAMENNVALSWKKGIVEFEIVVKMNQKKEHATRRPVVTPPTISLAQNQLYHKSDSPYFSALPDSHSLYRPEWISNCTFALFSFFFHKHTHRILYWYGERYIRKKSPTFYISQCNSFFS